MQPPMARELFETLESRVGVEGYNYDHFRTTHLLMDARTNIIGRGIQPGELAPDWELPRAGGGTLRLSEMRGRPVLLHLGSPS